jgi:hypothetical protein
MAYTVSKLITNAYYTAGVVARDFQTLEGSQLEDGLDFLNEILGDTSVDSDMIPYYTKNSFNSVIGQESYFIPHLIELTTLVFFIGPIRYQMNEIPRRAYFGSTRANNIETLPFTWHVERTFQADPNTNIPTEGAILSLYFIPNQAYPLECWGLYGLTDVQFNQNLELVYPKFYITYLKYALAVKICDEFSYEIPSGVNKRLEKYQESISKRSQELDLRLQKISTLGSYPGLNYAIINFGGWTV